MPPRAKRRHIRHTTRQTEALCGKRIRGIQEMAWPVCKNCEAIEARARKAKARTVSAPGDAGGDRDGGEG